MKYPQISVCVPTYNRSHIVGQSFYDLLDDDRVSEIVLMDDRSTQKHQDKLYADWWPHKKVRLYRSKENFGMSLNKKRAIYFSTNEWCILLDDDNVLKKDYVDSLYNLSAWYSNEIYCPSYAMPHFDYQHLNSLLYCKKDVHQYLNVSNFTKHLNTCNYFVNREAYLQNHIHDPSVKAADTIWFAYNWLKHDNYFFINPDQRYIHTVHEGSGWRQDLTENREKAKEILKLIGELR